MADDHRMRIFRFIYLFLALVLLSLQAMGMPHGGSFCTDVAVRCCGQGGSAKLDDGQEPPSVGADCCALQAGPQPVASMRLPGAIMAPQQACEPHPLTGRAVAPPLRPPTACSSSC